MDIRHAVGVKENIDEETLAALRDWRTSDHFSGREKAALELTEVTGADSREVSDACFARVRESFSEADSLELVFVIGYRMSASEKYSRTRAKQASETSRSSATISSVSSSAAFSRPLKWSLVRQSRNAASVSSSIFSFTPTA